MNLYPSTLARDAALEALPAAAWTHEHRTFTEFLADLDRLLPFADSDPTPRREARDVGRFALLSQAARMDAGELERVAGSERALRSAGALLASWKGANLRPDDLRAAADDLEINTAATRVGGTVRRLARLYELYESRLGKNWTDREAAERVLLRRLEACDPIPSRLLKPNETITLHGFHKLAYVQTRVVQKLLRLEHAVTVRSAIFSDGTQGATKYPGLAKTFAAARFETIDANARNAPSTARMEAPSPYAEAYEIGRRVRRWISEEKIAPSRIAVAFRDLGPYSQALHDVFRRLGIPFYERRGEPATFQPLVRVALSAIDACIDTLDRVSVFRFLCAGPVNVPALANVPNDSVSPDALRSLALEAGIDRSHDLNSADAAAQWRAKLKRFMPGQAGDAKKRSSFKKERHAQALSTILQRMNQMRADRTAHAHVQAWRAFFETAGLSAAAFSDAQAGEVPIKERLAIAALEAALKTVAEIPNASTETLSLEAFAELLNAAIQEQSIRADGLERAGVRVLNFYDLRGLSFQRLVIGGMSEGLCPARGGGDPLLGQGAERALRNALAARVADRDAGSYLAPRLSHETDEEERALFDGALACGEEQVLLSRPERGFDGGALGASEYWDAFAGPIDMSMAIHPAPQLSECITKEETELRAAWILGGGIAAPDERAAALGAYAFAPRLKALARTAAVERARYQFFLDQSIAAVQNEKGASENRVPGAAGIYDGMIAALSIDSPSSGAAADFAAIEADVAKRLAPGGIGDPMLGPSDLEKLAACPFRFLLERVCRFNQAEEPGAEVSPLDVGELWHAVLNRFYKEELEHAAAAGEIVARLDRKRRDAYVNRLLFFAGEELHATASEKYIGHAGFWKLQEERVRAVLGTWLDCELLEADGFHPARVEFDFGPEAVSGVPELKVPLGSGASALTLRIKGRMDRLDLKIERRDGVDTVVAVRVIDYKLGRGHRYKAKTEVGAMSTLQAAQLPIYVAAAIDYLFKLRDEKSIAVDFDSVWNASRAGYYSLRDTPFSKHGDRARLVEVKAWPLGDLKTFLDASAPQGSGALFDLARTHLAATLSGRFPVQPLDCSGLYCPSRYACRYQAIPAMEEVE